MSRIPCGLCSTRPVLCRIASPPQTTALHWLERHPVASRYLDSRFSSPRRNLSDTICCPDSSKNTAVMTREDPPHDSPGEDMASQREQPPAPPERETIPTNSEPPSIASSQTTRTANDYTRSQAALHAKVAIPRQRSGVAPRFNRRVPRACESCRQRKTKCSGDTPVCRQCRELRVTCQYPAGWKERTKK